MKLIVFLSTFINVLSIYQWILNYIDTFNGAGEENSWSENRLSSCDNSFDVFLGGSCNFGGDAKVYRTFSNLLSHTHLRVTMRVHFIDNWEGESLIVAVDDEPVWAKAHFWCPQRFQGTCDRFGLNTCGHWYPDKMSYPVVIDLPHSSASAKITVYTNLNKSKNSCESSWGIDDVALYTHDMNAVWDAQEEYLEAKDVESENKEYMGLWESIWNRGKRDKKSKTSKGGKKDAKHEKQHTK